MQFRAGPPHLPRLPGNSVVLVEHVALLRAGNIGRDRRKKMLAESVGKDLEVDMCGAAAMPAGIDRLEGNDALVVGMLEATQELLVRRVGIATVTLPRIAGIDTLRVAMPDIDPRREDFPRWVPPLVHMVTQAICGVL